jgi:hypothetical protein
MSFRIFHYGNEADENYFLTGRFDGWTGRLKCCWWEWSGWYNGDIYQRLLGHYLLFQHFKKDDILMKRSVNVAHAYILQYRSAQSIKYGISRISAMAWSILTLGRSFPNVEIEGINRILVNEGAGILLEFLTGSEVNFRKAMFNAVKKIKSPSFICMTAKGFSTAYLLQFNKQVNTQVNSHHNESFTEVNHHHNESFTEIHNPPAIKEGATGKEKDVFSKRQWLIIFDLFSEMSKLEKIDFSKSNKLADIADLFHALTGKSKTSFLDELKEYRNTEDLYRTNNKEELQNLISTISNLSGIFHKAGFRSFSTVANKKMNELETKKKRDYPSE